MSYRPESAVSVAVMHHPKRADTLPELLAACGSLPARVITDPDPNGPPSPLRTAKRAWAAIADGATHHLVLQDDVTPIAHFDEHLPAAVAAHPDRAITLHIGWQSAPNAYHVRLAAAVGSPWAALSPSWTPTYGLLLPIAAARELATYLADIPDARRDDDRVITRYLAEAGIAVLAPVPHLLEHADDIGVTGNADDGRRRATVFLPEHSVDWTTSTGLLAALAGAVDTGIAIELHNSECRIRFARPDSVETMSHAFGWYWAEWCPLLGVAPDDVLTGLPPHAEPRLAAEVWAAAWLLGFQAARVAPDPKRDDTVLRAALASWIDSGLCDTDLAAPRESLIDLAMIAVEHGGKT